MTVLSEPEPERGRAHEVAEGILRLVARNPGSMTCHGTNTYLIEAEGGFVVLDPGPATDPLHAGDILAATGGRIAGLVVTHGHHDHVGGLAALKTLTGAPSLGFPKSLAVDFIPDTPLVHGDVTVALTALHTPGHAPDHLCFSRADGLVFTGDHIMGWSSSVVFPPHGSMADYVASLQTMMERDDRIYLPGHGPAMPEPRAYFAELRRRRIAREADILAVLRAGPLSVPEIALRLYAKLDPVLKNASERNVMSHLHKLSSEGRVDVDGAVWIALD